MPGRKSNISTITNGESETPVPSSASRPRQSSDRDGFSVEDLNLPRTMIQRLAKGVLPANTQIQKDALLALSKSATVFVNFLASNASEYATMSGKKTIMPHDVFAALKDHEFDAFLPRVEAETTKYNEIQCDKRNSYRRKVKADKAVVPSSDAPGEEGEGEDGDGEGIVNGVNGLSSGKQARVEGEEPPAKKVRREEGDEDEDEGDDVEDDEGDEAGAEEADEGDGEEDDEDEVEEEEDEVEDEIGENGALTEDNEYRNTLKSVDDVMDADEEDDDDE